MIILSILTSNWHTYRNGSALPTAFGIHVQVAHFERMCLNEVSSGFDFITHQNRKDLVDAGDVLQL